MKLFDDTFVSEAPKCVCCYSCMNQHRLNGCDRCSTFLAKFFPLNQKVKVTKSVGAELKESIVELFGAMGMDSVLIENELKVTISSFAKDFLKMADELKTKEDIVELWHIDPIVAEKLFNLFNEVVFGVLDDAYNDNREESDSESDVIDESSDSD